MVNLMLLFCKLLLLTCLLFFRMSPNGKILFMVPKPAFKFAGCRVFGSKDSINGLNTTRDSTKPSFGTLVPLVWSKIVSEERLTHFSVTSWNLERSTRVSTHLRLVSVVHQTINLTDLWYSYYLCGRKASKPHL